MRRPGALSIAVFGFSEPAPGEPLYESARRVGALLAEAGYEIVTGGYGGVMDGASRGAIESGGWATGVVSSIFGDRLPSRHLSEVVVTASLEERMSTLIERAAGYVVLHGQSGTLAEATLVWALERAGSLDPRPVILLGGSWARVLALLTEERMLGAVELRVTQAVEHEDQVVPALRARLRDPGRT